MKSVRLQRELTNKRQHEMIGLITCNTKVIAIYKYNEQRFHFHQYIGFLNSNF